MKKVKPIYFALILLALTIVSQMFNMYNYSYFVDEQALITLQQASIAKIIFLVFDGVNDIFFAYLSEKSTFKFGKRKAWLILFMPFICVALIATFAANSSMPFARHEFWLYYIFITIMFDNFSSILYINYNALFPVLYINDDERRKASSLSHFGEIIGIGIIALTCPILKDTIGYLETSVICCIVFIILMTISLMNISEPRADIKQAKEFSFKKAWRDVFKNKAFIFYSLSTASFLTILGTFITIMPFLTKYTLKITGVEQTIITGVAFFMIIISIRVWSFIIKKKGHRFVYKLSFTLLPIGLLFIGLSFNFVTAIISLSLGLPLAGGLLIAPDLMMADIIDEDKRKYHLNREAALLSLSSFAKRLALLVSACILMIFTTFSGYVNGAEPGDNPEMSFRLISALFLPFVALLGTICSRIYLRISADGNSRTEGH